MLQACEQISFKSWILHSLQGVDNMLGKKSHDDDEFVAAEDPPSP